MKVKKKNTTRIPHTNKKKHIIQLFTKQMSNVGRCKSAKHDSLFMIYIASHETNICIAKIMRNNIVDIKIMLNN